MSAALLALAVLLPTWAWSPFVLDDPRFDGALLSLVVAAAALLFRPARLLRGSGLVLAALALGALPLLLAPEPPAWGGLADRAPLLSALVLAALAAARPAAFERALPWILGGVFLAAGYGLLQRFGADPLGWRPDADSPPTAPLAGTNHGAELLLLALVTAVARPGRRSARGWWLLAALPVAFHAGAFGVTAFRIGLPLGLGWAAWRDRSRIAPAALVLAAALAGELANRPDPAAEAEPAATIQAAEPAAADDGWSSWEIRWLTHSDVLGKALRTPLGIGLGRFETSYPLWRSPETLRAASHGYTTPETPVHKDPHDEPLLLLIECGWLGALLGLAGFALLLRRPQRPRWSSAPLLALAVPLLVRAPLSDNPAALAFAALLAGASLRREASAAAAAGPQTRSSGPAGWPLPGRLAVPGLALLAALAAPAQIGGERSIARSLRSPAGGDPLRSAVAWRPWDSRAWDFLAVDLGRRGAPLGSIREALGQALRHDPGDLFALDSLFTLELEAGRYEAALAALARAEALAPDHPAVTSKREWMATGLPARVEELVAGGDFLPALARLTEAEGLAPKAPAVVAARSSLYRAWAADHRKAAGELFQQAAENRDFEAAGSLKMRQHFLLAHLFEALAHARDGQIEACRKSLQAAATYADAQHALVQRTARRQDLNEELVRVLMLRFDPQLEAWLGSAAGED